MKQSTALVCALVLVSLGLGALFGWKACLVFVGGAGAVATATRRKSSEAISTAEKTSESAMISAESVESSLATGDAEEKKNREANVVERIAMWDSADTGIDRTRIDD